MTQPLFIQIGLVLVLCFGKDKDVQEKVRFDGLERTIEATNLRESHCSPYRNIVGSSLLGIKSDESSRAISPTMDPQPLLPLLAPSPLMPFTNNSVPRLSGLCTLNFSAAESILTTTATDCWSLLAPYLANVVCCPQFHATLANLIGQSSIYSGKLALNATHAKHCLSDIEHILEGQGANGNLQKICQIYPSNLTEATCPVTDVSKVECIVDVSGLLSACEKIDPVNECCNKICENAILDAAEKIVLENHSTVQPQNLAMVNDCKSIVSRWVASKLDLSSANRVLRGLSSCNINKVCPLVFPNTRNVSRDCGNITSNWTGCCEAMESYMSNLQEQSFITNVQASNCAALLGKKLQRANVSIDVYNLCHINLKDFSLQVESQETGCLLPSLPSDVTYDESSGIGFVCDLNDNLAAPWPSSSLGPASSCNKTTELPALPKATSAQTGLHARHFIYSQHFSCLLVLKFLI